MDYFTDQLEEEFKKLSWDEIYSFVEFFAARLNSRDKEVFIMSMNRIFYEEGAPYEMPDNQIVALMTQEEAQEIMEAKEGQTGASEHIKKAIEQFNKRPYPDYENSIKESISAVEALVGEITGNPTDNFSQSIKKLRLHSALEQAIIKLYAWTSDESGIRHSFKEDGQSPGAADARFMLVQCSLLVNFLKLKNR